MLFGILELLIRIGNLIIQSMLNKKVHHFCCRSILSRFNVGKATAIRSVRRVTNALLEISKNIVCWPSQNNIEDVKNGFLQMGMPNTIGCLDGMHVRIPKPKEHGISYINRKGFPSIILQVSFYYIVVSFLS